MTRLSKKLDKGAIFICSDKSWYEVDKPAYHKLKVIKYKSRSTSLLLMAY